MGDMTTCIPSLLHQLKYVYQTEQKPPQMSVQTLMRIRASLFKFLLFSKMFLFFVTLQNVYGNTPCVTIMSHSLQVTMAT